MPLKVSGDNRKKINKAFTKIMRLLQDTYKRKETVDRDNLEMLFEDWKKECMLQQKDRWDRHRVMRQKKESDFFLQDNFCEPAEYETGVQYFLYETASHYDIRSFSYFLEQTHNPAILWEDKRSHFWSLSQAQTKVPELFLTHDPVCLELVLERSAVCASEYKTRLCWIRGVQYETDAPEIYAAIIAGDIEMVRFLLEHGVILEKDCGMEAIQCCEGMSESFEYGWQEMIEQPGMPEGFLAVYRQEGGYYIKTERRCNIFQKNQSVFHDPLTAAVLSQNRKMIHFISDLFPETEWNMALERSIVFSNDRMVQYLLENFPEILGFIRLSAVFEGKSDILLRAFLDAHQGSMESHWRELETYMDWHLAQSGITKYTTSILPDRTSGKKAAFCRMLWRAAPSHTVSEKLRKEIYMEINLSAGNDTFPLIQLFHEMCGDVTEDYTQCFLRLYPVEFRYQDAYRRYRWQTLSAIGKGKRAQFGSIDLYTKSSEWESALREDNRTYQIIMRCFAPLEIRPQTECFTEGVLSQNQNMLTAYAIKKGYITPVNALALYEYAVTLPKCSEEILMLLIRTANETM